MKAKLIALTLLFAVGCSNGKPADQTKAIADRVKRVRSDIENLKSDYSEAISASERDEQVLMQKRAALKEKMAQLDKLLANLVLPGPPPSPPPGPVLPDPVKPVVPEPVKPIVPVLPVVPDVPKPSGPSFPPSKLNLAADVYRWSLEKVKSPDRAAQAKILGDSAADFAELVNPGDPARKPAVSGLTRYDLASKIQDLLGKKNKDIPPEILAAWKDMEGSLNERIGVLFSAGKLTNNSDWGLLFREIAAGLREVKS